MASVLRQDGDGDWLSPAGVLRQDGLAWRRRSPAGWVPLSPQGLWRQQGGVLAWRHAGHRCQWPRQALGQEDWPAASADLRSLAATPARLAGKAGQPLETLTYLAPVLYPNGIYCAGANYRDHANEMARAQGKPEPVDPHTLGLHSWHFIKIGHCVTGGGTTVKLPTQKVDWEVELAAIIGKTCRNATLENALSFIMGYTVANDLSARDLGQRKGLPDNSNFRADWVSHKCFDGS